MLQKAQEDKKMIRYGNNENSDEDDRERCESAQECEIKKKRLDLLMSMAQKKKDVGSKFLYQQKDRLLRTSTMTSKKPLMPKMASKGANQSTLVKMQKRLSVHGLTAERFNNNDFELIPTEELAILYYITNLVLLEDYRVAESLITKKVLKMTHISSTLRGNALRLQALCRFEMLRASTEENRELKRKARVLKPGEI